MTMLTLEETRALQPGDKVRMKHESWKEPVEGRVWLDDRGTAQMGGFSFDYLPGTVFTKLWEIELLERGPRPFYRNVERQPVPGDVARLHEDDMQFPSQTALTWTCRTDSEWVVTHTGRPIGTQFGRLRPVLIVDGPSGLPVMPESVVERLADLYR